MRPACTCEENLSATVCPQSTHPCPCSSKQDMQRTRTYGGNPCAANYESSFTYYSSRLSGPAENRRKAGTPQEHCSRSRVPMSGYERAIMRKRGQRKAASASHKTMIMTKEAYDAPKYAGAKETHGCSTCSRPQQNTSESQMQRIHTHAYQKRKAISTNKKNISRAVNLMPTGVSVTSPLCLFRF